MKERPILFSGAMVRAILSGRKTVTRRVLRPLNASCGESMEHMGDRYRCEVAPGGYARMVWSTLGSVAVIPLPTCPLGAPGDRLWVRETWRPEERPTDSVDGIRYAADRAFVPIEATPAAAARWVETLKPGLPGERPNPRRPSIHMPRWASRLTLAVTSVRVERLQSITDADVKAEGVAGWSKDRALYKYAPADHEGDGPCWPWVDCPRSPREGFAKLWDEIAPKGAQWGDDPWVWVVGFRRVEVTP